MVKRGVREPDVLHSGEAFGRHSVPMSRLPEHDGYGFPKCIEHLADD
jgi:hypothetical protein